MTKYVSLFNTRVLLADVVELLQRVTRLASNSFDAWMLGLWQAQTQKEGNLTAVPSTESTLLLESRFLNIYINVAILHVLQKTEGNKSFIWYKQLNYDITDICMDTFFNNKGLLHRSYFQL